MKFKFLLKIEVSLSQGREQVEEDNEGRRDQNFWMGLTRDKCTRLALLASMPSGLAKLQV